MLSRTLGQEQSKSWIPDNQAWTWDQNSPNLPRLLTAPVLLQLKWGPILNLQKVHLNFAKPDVNVLQSFVGVCSCFKDVLKLWPPLPYFKSSAAWSNFVVVSHFGDLKDTMHIYDLSGAPHTEEGFRWIICVVSIARYPSWRVQIAQTN